MSLNRVTMMSKHSARGRRWQVFRQWCIKRAGFKCSNCGNAGRLEVHHKVPVSQGGIWFDPNNVEVLCRRCHFAQHPSENPARAEWYKLIEAS